MKNTMKKLLALTMAIVMVMAMSVTAFAEDNGSITVENATKGQDYAVYKIFDATIATTTDEDGNVVPDGISYTASEAQKKFYEELEGNPFVFTENSDGTYYVTINENLGERGGVWSTENIADQYIIDFFKGLFVGEDGYSGLMSSLEYLSRIGIVGKGTSETADANTVKFEGLDYGYYLVTSSLGSAVSITSTQPDAKVIDKNTQEPTTDDDMKKIGVVGEDGTVSYVDATNASVGDVVAFKITVHAVNYVTKDDESEIVYQYVITDTPTNMAIDEKSITVAVGERGLVSGQYTVEIDDDGKLSVTIPWAKKSDENGDYDTSLYEAPVDIVVTYNAEILAGAVKEDDEGNTSGAANSAAASYNDSTAIGGGDKVTVSTYYFDLTKTDGGKAVEGQLNTNVLAGAVFEIYETEDGTTPITLVDEGNGVYHVADSTEIAGAGVEGSTITLVTAITTPESGKVQVKGLGNGTYYLEETKAPDGYNKLDGRQSIEIKDSDKADTVENGTTTAYGVEVENNAGTELPETGGIGTTIFTVVGSILVIGAAILLITKKRMGGATK